MPVKTTSRKKKTSPAKKKTSSIDITLDDRTFARIEKYKAAHALIKDQEVIRMSIGFFLEKQGY